VASAAQGDALPKVEALRQLEEQVHAGYIRGVHKVLDQISSAQPECDAFVGRLRGLARQFQLDALAREVDNALNLASAQP